jgi:hypothetical protein
MRFFMKKTLFLLSIVFMQPTLFATIADDLTTEINNNDIPGVIATIDAASSSSVSLTQMLAYAETALEATTAPVLNNAARRYVCDFNCRPTISSTGSTILWVSQSLFSLPAFAAYNVIMTSDRIICKTIQQAMDYLGYVRGGQWTVVIDQDIYDADVSIPAGQAITMTGVGGVVIGNAGGDQWSSTVARTITWALNDSLNVAGVTPSLTMQSAPYGDGGYKNIQYMSSFLIGNFFVTSLTGTIASSPELLMKSVYAWSGQGSALVDIGPIDMIMKNFRTGGSINFTSATIRSMENSTMIPAVIAEDTTTTGLFCCGDMGDISDTVIFDAWTLTTLSGVITDCFFSTRPVPPPPPPGLPLSKTFTSPPTVMLNYASNYWFSLGTAPNLWIALPSKTVVDQ